MSAARRRPAVPPLSCPRCSRAFVIGPDFVMDVTATGLVQASGRAELACGICGYRWWSKHPEALRRARSINRSRRPRR